MDPCSHYRNALMWVRVKFLNSIVISAAIAATTWVLAQVLPKRFWIFLF